MQRRFTAGSDIDTHHVILSVIQEFLLVFISFFIEMAKEVLHPLRAWLTSLCSGRNGKLRLSACKLLISEQKMSQYNKS